MSMILALNSDLNINRVDDNLMDDLIELQSVDDISAVYDVCVFHVAFLFIDPRFLP